jgi:arylformamidase
VKAAGKPVDLVEAPNFNHFEMAESLGNPRMARMAVRRSR